MTAARLPSATYVVHEFGLDPGRVGEAARRPEELVGYLEAHIEQGPELDRRGESLAVVSSIAWARFQLIVEGEARHAGGTPYDIRRDALLGASEAALAVERICRAEHHIIGTVGQLEAFPGAVNIVPGEAHLSLDVRGEFDVSRDRVWTAIERDLDEIMGPLARPPGAQCARRVLRPAAAGGRPRGHPLNSPQWGRRTRGDLQPRGPRRHGHRRDRRRRNALPPQPRRRQPPPGRVGVDR
jgi:hypothetical protein